jgi:prophage regulatory protein
MRHNPIGLSPALASPAPALVRAQPTPDAVFLRLPTVMRMTGLGRSTIYRMIAAQRFPGPVQLGMRAVAWRRSDLEQWSASRPTAGR